VGLIRKPLEISVPLAMLAAAILGLGQAGGLE
jgi:hypothetical protein